MTSFRRLLLLLVGALALTACRLDVDVGVTVNADGSGEVIVAATVDKDVVDQVPGLGGSLILDDAGGAGWEVEGPAPTEEGGLAVTLRHPFATVQEAANLLNSLGPPFTTVAFERTATDDEVTVTLTGSLTLPGGTWDAFGDSALLQSTGGTVTDDVRPAPDPFASERPAPPPSLPTSGFAPSAPAAQREGGRSSEKVKSRAASATTDRRPPAPARSSARPAPLRRRR